MLRLLYFAGVREAVGTGEELVEPPPDVASVAALVDWLAATGAAHAIAFADRRRLRAAVDGRFCSLDAPLPKHGGEVALFPPVTGG